MHTMPSSQAPPPTSLAARGAAGDSAVPSRPSPFSTLPTLALELIFSYLPHPQAFALINKEMYGLTQSTHVRAMWFMAQWGKSLVLSRKALHSTHGGTILGPRVLPVLIRRGADVSADGWFVVQHAADSGYVDVLAMVLDNVNDEVKRESGWRHAVDRALMVAADNGDRVVVQLALHHGANINTHSSYPLRYAAYKHHLPLVKYLLQHGAHPNVHAITLTVAPIRDHLVHIQNLPNVSQDQRHALATCPHFKKRILRATEILRWLVWFSLAGTDSQGLERVADHQLRALESLPNYPLDATGSKWFVDQPPRIVVTPPPNPLALGASPAELQGPTPDGDAAAGQDNPAPLPANPAPAASIVPPPPTAGFATPAAAAVVAAAPATETLQEPEVEDEPQVSTVTPDLQLEGLTKMLGTVHPFASRASTSSGSSDNPDDEGVLALVASSAVIA